MITVVDCDNKHLYREQLEEHYRIRHKIYVEDRRWMALERPDGREVDQFDNDDAVYLLALDEGRVIGGSRLVPTLKPHLMADVFPYLANVEGVQRGPDIIEWTRIFVIPEMRGPDSKVLHTVMAGMLEYCLQEDISAITVVMETWWLPRFLELGWEVKALGLPAMIENMNCIGAMISVTEDAWLNTLAFKGINGPVLETPRAQPPLRRGRIIHA